jgi:uncharacterized membrane protein YeaQ/YmgE (transglycosylase-associated protein family)
MEHINSSTELQARIGVLQAQALEERLALKQEITEIVTNINPIKLITHGLKEIITSEEMKEGLFSLTMGMSAGYVAKKIVTGKSENAIQHIAGNVVGMVVSKNVAMHSDQIRSAGMLILKGIFSSSRNKSTEV